MDTPTEKDRGRCVCPRCPTYKTGDTGLFCVHGKSKMDVVEQGCLCRTCPVHLEYRLKGREYCVRGRSEGQ